MSLKSTLVPTLYFAGALTFGTLGIMDATKTIGSADNYAFMKKAAESVTLDAKKEAEYRAFISRDDVYWYGGKTLLEFLLTGFLVSTGIKKTRPNFDDGG